MMHPYLEIAEGLREEARFEARDKWADRERIRRLTNEAREYERLAAADTEYDA